MLQTFGEQQFLESIRDAAGKIPTGKALESFSSWIYDQVDQFPKFDMALLVLGADYTGNADGAFYAARCKHQDRRSTSYFVDRGSFNTIYAARGIGRK